MTLQELMKAVDELSPAERQALRYYIDQQVHDPNDLSPEERIRRLDAAAAAIREGMTQAELAEMTAAMNDEFVEAFDEAEWKD